MCREFFDKAFMPTIDLELAQEAMNFNKSEFEERKAELIEEGEWFGEGGALIKMCLGNNYEKVKVPTVRGRNGEICNHRWAMFLTLNNDKKLTERYIKEVRYELHPTYKISKITIKEAPFMLSRCAYGSFNIEATVVFQPWTKAKPLLINHMLSYDKGGAMRSQFIEGKAIDSHKSPGMNPTKADLQMMGKVLDGLKKLDAEGQAEEEY
jgi:hypothetical protein